jgi:serine protease
MNRPQSCYRPSTVRYRWRAFRRDRGLFSITGSLRIMKSFVRTQTLCAAIGLALTATASAAGPDPNRVIVKFAPGAAGNVEAAVGAANGRVHHRFDELGAMAITVPPQALNGLRNNPNVLYIEQDVARYPSAQTVPYGVPMVQAPDLVATGADGTGIKVCVIDSGIKANHEDFAGVSMTGYASSGQSWNTDSCGHGTHVAGTIAAANNSLGVVGVSPGKVSLHIVKVFDGASCGWSYSSTLIDAANRCASAGAKVINMSLGGSTSSTTEKNAFDNLYSQGVLSIAAAGNDGNNRHSYPASYDSVVSVAAIDSTKTVASFSQFTNQVELAAPGVGVLSTYPISGGSAQVGSTSYLASAMELSAATTASAGWVNGGRCTSTGGGSYSGKIVLCERGDIAFGDKVTNVKNGGGIGAIIYNNAPGGFGGTLGTASTIPAVSISQEDGQDILANGNGLTATVDARTLSNANGYAYLDGTSMATPHVAGVAAIVWSAKPTATNAEVRTALRSTAQDLGAAGRDNYYGYGLVRALEAAAALTSGGGGGGSDPGAPTSLTGTKTNKGPNYTYSLRWSGGATTVDIFRGTTKVRSAVSNTGSYSETVKNLSSATYKVCNAGSSTACASVSL